MTGGPRLIDRRAGLALGLVAALLSSAPSARPGPRPKPAPPPPSIDVRVVEHGTAALLRVERATLTLEALGSPVRRIDLTPDERDRLTRLARGALEAGQLRSICVGRETLLAVTLERRTAATSLCEDEVAGEAPWRELLAMIRRLAARGAP